MLSRHNRILGIDRFLSILQRARRPAKPMATKNASTIKRVPLRDGGAALVVPGAAGCQFTIAEPKNGGVNITITSGNAWVGLE